MVKRGKNKKRKITDTQVSQDLFMLSADQLLLSPRHAEEDGPLASTPAADSPKSDKNVVIENLLPQLIERLRPVIISENAKLLAELRSEIEAKDREIAGLRAEVTRLNEMVNGNVINQPEVQVVNETVHVVPDERYSELEHKLDELNQYSRRNCLKIKKIPVRDLQGISVENYVIGVAEFLGVYLHENDIGRAHVLGAPFEGKVNIIVRFVRHNVKDMVYSKRMGLKHHPARIVIQESLTNHRHNIFKALDALRYKEELFRTSTRDGKILFKFSPTSKTRQFNSTEIPFNCQDTAARVERLVRRWRNETAVIQDDSITERKSYTDESGNTIYY